MFYMVCNGILQIVCDGMIHDPEHYVYFETTRVKALDTGGSVYLK